MLKWQDKRTENTVKQGFLSTEPRRNNLYGTHLL
uniref:Uncharacterized protein n=1 Tax=Anguilla anguilla TaxID=7936 RepID=A0A0E9TYJ4_ANGAN